MPDGSIIPESNSVTERVSPAKSSAEVPPSIWLVDDVRILILILSEFKPYYSRI